MKLPDRNRVAAVPGKLDGEVDIEIFSCAGGMAEGFRRAGFTFDLAVDLAPDHVESYAQNLGHRPICMDARDFLRLLQAGLRVRCRLLVADPPCTPWSRAGKRKGLSDDRDMLRVTAQIIELLRPRVYLIGNVPGLEDSNNLGTVQDVIGGLARFGYCTVDFARLDAADFGVPQHRIRPFWFGHLEGPCLRWPTPTHCDRSDLVEINASGEVVDKLVLPGIDRLLPYVTCGEALAHLSGKDLGRRVKLRKRDCNTKQHGSVLEKPARVVGTSGLSDGNVVLDGVARVGQIKREQERRGQPKDEILQARGTGNQPSYSDEPAKVMRATTGGGSHRAMVISRGHPPSYGDQPANTVRGSDGGGSRRAVVMDHKVDRTLDVDRPARTVTTTMGEGAQPLVWNDRHQPAQVDQPAPTMGAKYRGQSAQVLELPAKPYKRSTQGPQSQRVAPTDKPATTIQCRTDRLGSGMLIDWMNARPATTVMSDPRLAPPGTRGADGKVKGGGRARSTRDAIMLSPKAAAILQGFPETWVFAGATKKAVWSQIGQAMPPRLAEVVALAIAVQLAETVPGERPPGHVESFTPPRPAAVEQPAAQQLELMVPVVEVAVIHVREAAAEGAA